jgi:hypothetical protein
MCVIVPFTFPNRSTKLNLKVSQRRPIDRIIYHIVAFGQLLLFMSWNVWIFLAIYCETLSSIIPDMKFLFYSDLLMASILVWIIASTGKHGEIRWWPSKDRFSRLVPPSIKNATMTKGRWTLLFYRF